MNRGAGVPEPDKMLEQLPADVVATLSAIDEHKGLEPVVLDMRAVAGFTDFMVLCTGRSDPHVQALVDAVQERLRQRGRQLDHVEGRREASWVLLDFVDLVVHVFSPEARAFYQLERLWRDAPMIEWGVESPDEE